MRNSKLALVMALIFVLAGWNAVEAVTINAGDRLQLHNGPGDTNGGEFYVNILDRGATTSPFDFITFCIERDEYISFGQTYWVKKISDTAQLGGVNTDSGDPLDERTAYLFTRFTLGTLPGYDHSPGRADLLQMAIWHFEREITLTSGQISSNPYIALAETAVAGPNPQWDGIGNVRVINLVDAGGYYKQDQLVLVPEPATILLLGAGLLGAGIFRRRMK